jgi:hypothetical protein
MTTGVWTNSLIEVPRRRRKLSEQVTAGMCNSRDPYAVSQNSVHDAIVADDQFPYACISIFRHHSSELGECLQSINGEEDAVGKFDSVNRRILSNVGDDFVEVSACSYRPDDFCHFAILRLTCS